MTNLIEEHFNSLIENYEHKVRVAKAKKEFFLESVKEGRLTQEEATDLALNYTVR